MDQFASRVSVVGTITKNTEGIVKGICKCMLIDDRRADATTWSRMLEFGLVCGLSRRRCLWGCICNQWVTGTTNIFTLQPVDNWNG